MKKFYLKLLAVLIFLLQADCLLQAQNKFVLPQISPKSPNASEFEKYGDVPVSMPNGSANVSIPLYTIKLGSLDIPITLSYNSSGLKVNEIPSFVGMGWSINAGGAINYEQRGLPDHSVSGFGMFSGGAYNSLDSLKKFLRNQMTPADKNLYLEKITEGEVDGQFDFYNFNFLNYSGSFYQDTNQKIVQVPASNLRISNRNTITDEKGNRFVFNATDMNEIGPDPDPALALKRSFNENATYYLSSIQTADNRTAYFAYGPSPFSYSTSNRVVTVVSSRPYSNCPYNSVGTAYTYVNLNNNLLNTITFDGGRIEFEMSTEYRNDILTLSPTSYVPYLKKVKVFNSVNTLITEFTFNYTNGTGRLVLNEVVKTDAGGNPLRWQFEYIGGTNFSSLFVGGTDHWGYANGSSKGIPNADYATIVSGWAGQSPTVNKESSFDASKVAMLQKVTYPTGGSSTFTYESNSITFTSPSQPGTFLRRSYPTTPVTLVDENTYSQDEVYGSFTLTEPTLVRVNGYKYYQPTGFIESYVSLSQTPGGTNMLNSSPYGWQCNSWACTASATVTLPAGTYYYTLKKYASDGGFYVDGLATLEVSKLVPQASFTYLIGGCRVASILHSDSLGNTITKKYRYTDRYDSVGYFNDPYYLSKVTASVTSFGPGCMQCGLRTTISEESVKPMSGNPVEYLYVSEYTDDNGNNGITQYSFTGNTNLNPGAAPYLNPFKTKWKAGLLKNKKQFRKNGAVFEIVQLDSTAYEAIDPNTGVSQGIKSEYSDYCITSGLGYRYYNYQTEVYRTEQHNTKSQSEIYYDGAGKITATSVNIFGSSKHTLPTEIRTVTSGGDTLKERIKYSFDYDTSTATGNEAKAIRLLQRKNILAPIEKVSTKKLAGVDYVTKAIIFTYKSDTTVVDKVFELLLAAPAVFSGFTNSVISAGNLTKDSRYDESAKFTKYDEYQNVLQMQASNNVVNSYIWDYNQQFAVCEVSGAAQSEIGFTSFESGNNGNWTVSGGTLDSTYAFTGRRCLNPNAGSLSKTGLTVGKLYIISYWSRSGAKTITGASGSMKTGIVANGWTYYEHLATASASTITVSGSGLLDELRIYPAGAQMTSFTYTPSVGITSQCDPRNNVMYYEYDGLNRLMHIRDIKKNVIKKVQYIYRSNTLLP